MSLIIPPGFAQAVYEFQWAGDGEPMVTTLGHSTENAGGDFQTMANRLHLSFATNMVPPLADVVTLVGVSLYVGQDGTSTEVYESIGDPASGTADGTSLPSNSAYLLRKRTGAAGRRGRGRMYIPGCGEGQVDNLGMVDPTHLAVLQAAADDWYEALNGSLPGNVDYPPYVLHRSEGAGVEPPPTLITVFQIDPKIATQRQRLRR